MIALCLHHHKFADSGAYSNEQLREYKQRKPPTPPGGGFAYRLPDVVFSAGGALAACTSQFVVINDDPVIWLSSDDKGNQMLNIELRSSDGSTVFSMRDNEWKTTTLVEDLECPPSGMSLALRAPSLGIELYVKFSRIGVDQFKEMLSSRAVGQQVPDVVLSSVQSGITGKEMTHIRLKARLAFPKEIIISDENIAFGNITFSGYASIGGKSAIAFKI